MKIFHSLFGEKNKRRGDKEIDSSCKKKKEKMKALERFVTKTVLGSTLTFMIVYFGIASACIASLFVILTLVGADPFVKMIVSVIVGFSLPGIIAICTALLVFCYQGTRDEMKVAWKSEEVEVEDFESEMDLLTSHA